MRSQIAAVLAAVAGLSACGSSPGPDSKISPAPPPRDTAHYSAPLLRRLAEAADGYRDGKDHFIVVSLEAPHAVAEVADTREAAESIATTRSTESLHFAAFGPYRTEPDSLVTTADVDSVVAYLSDKTRRVYDGRQVDALFWSLPAYDKFIAPYEAAVHGVGEAARRRELYRRDQHPGTGSKPLPHYRNSF